MFDVEELPTHGGSPAGVGRATAPTHPRPSAGVEHVRAAERAAGLDNPDAYDSFTAGWSAAATASSRSSPTPGATGTAVAAYGAAAKGNTFLNYCGVTADDIDYVVDRSPHKQGLLLPGIHLPIHAPDHVAETRPDYLLILPWNLRDEIAEQMDAIRDLGWPVRRGGTLGGDLLMNFEATAARRRVGSWSSARPRRAGLLCSNVLRGRVPRPRNRPARGAVQHARATRSAGTLRGLHLQARTTRGDQDGPVHPR